MLQQITFFYIWCTYLSRWEFPVRWGWECEMSFRGVGGRKEMTARCEAAALISFVTFFCFTLIEFCWVSTFPPIMYPSSIIFGTTVAKTTLPVFPQSLLLLATNLVTHSDRQGKSKKYILIYYFVIHSQCCSELTIKGWLAFCSNLITLKVKLNEIT